MGNKTTAAHGQLSQKELFLMDKCYEDMIAAVEISETCQNPSCGHPIEDHSRKRGNCMFIHSHS